MERLCQVKAEAAGGDVVQAVQSAGTSLESRLQVITASHHIRLCQNHQRDYTPHAGCVLEE